MINDTNVKKPFNNQTLSIEISIKYLIFIIFFLFSIAAVIIIKFYMSLQSSIDNFSEQNIALLNRISILEKQVNYQLLTNTEVQTVVDPIIHLTKNSDEYSTFIIKITVIIISVILSTGVLYWGVCYFQNFVTETLLYKGFSLLNTYGLNMIGFTTRSKRA